MNTPSTPRTDLPFLRRRIKPGRALPVAARTPTAAAAPTAAASTSPSLSLRQPAAPLQAPAAMPQARTTAAPAAPAPAAPSGPSSGPSLTLRPPPARDQPAAAPPAQSAAPSAGPSLTLRQAAPEPASTQAAPARLQPGMPVSVRPASATATQAVAQRPAGLVLGGAAPASSTSPRAQKVAAQREKAKREDHEVRLLFPAPGISDIYELNFVDRVLRLTALESSVGTLVVSGSTAVAWEDVRRVTGGQTVDGHKAGSPVMTSGNRELVGYHGRDALVSLHHVRELRRALFINRSSAAMGVRLFNGESVALPPAADGTQIVLLLHRIGNVLEMRAEPVPHNWTDLQIWQEFDFAMTHRAPASAYGR